METIMKIAILQTPVTDDKTQNIEIASQAIKEAAACGAEMAVLPEMFCCPYDNKCFPEYGEEKGGYIYSSMAEAADRNGIYLVAGSMPEWEDGRLYNTSFVFDPDGSEIVRHRKVHLFDIDVKGGQSFKESDVLTPGEDITIFHAGNHSFGLAICFDIRFPEMFRIMALQGAEAVIVPAAFNMTTGPAHWELNFRSRALDNQYFTIGAAPSRNEESSYISYSHSIVCSPWGDTIAQAGIRQEILQIDLDFSKVEEIRRQLPLLSARRPEIYGKYAFRETSGNIQKI